MIITYLSNLNLFPSIPPSTNPRELQTQRLSTRVFIVAFLMIFFILFIYTSAVTNLKTITIDSPTVEQYNDLYSLYPQSLVCPCTQLSVNYEKFIVINHTFHQICGSFYVTDAWITLLIDRRQQYLSLDFRVIGAFMFQGIRSLCELVKEAIVNSLGQFYSNDYISL